MVSMLSADLPIGESNPVRRIMFLKDRMAGLKESKQAVGADFLGEALGVRAPDLARARRPRNVDLAAHGERRGHQRAGTPSSLCI